MKVSVTPKGYYYISKSVWKDGRSTSVTVEKLGTADDIRNRMQDPEGDPLAWAKEYAKQLTEKEKEEKHEVIVKYSPSKIIAKDERRSFNVGYLFLQQVYYEIGLRNICAAIERKYRFDYSLNAVLSRLVYSRILYPASKLATFDLSKRFLEQPAFELQHVYRALDVLAKESDYIQSSLFRGSLRTEAGHTRKKLPKRGVLYYDCTNYYFETEQEDTGDGALRRYGHSKEHRPNPIVQMGLFIDRNGLPLSFCVFPGNRNETLSLSPTEQKIIDANGGEDNIVVCTDSGLASLANRRFNDRGGRGYIVTQPIKKLKQFLIGFCLGTDGWHLRGSKDSSGKLIDYDLKKIYPEDFGGDAKAPDPKKDTDGEDSRVFYKDRWIKEDGIEQHLIVTYSKKYRDYLRSVREGQVQRAQKLADNPAKLNRKTPNDPARFVKQEHSTPGGEAADRSITYVDDQMIGEEEKYDGFYAVCTNLKDRPEDIIEVNKMRWKIEACFRIMKTEFRSRPVYLARKDRIEAHFMTCFLALLVYRRLELKLNKGRTRKYTCDEILATLAGMDMVRTESKDYIPAYTRTDLTDALHETFGFRTDYQIVKGKEMKKICTDTKKKSV